MAVDSAVSLFTTTMRTEFERTFDPIAKPLAYERYTEIIPSTARIESYNWMSPTPGIKEFKGHREYATIHNLPYRVENREWDAAFQVPLRDIRDDQTGGYRYKARELGVRARIFPSRLVAKLLNANGACFDGSNFFADSHNLGTGDNNLAFDGSANDGKTYTLIALFHGGPLKPVLYQNRMGPEFRSTEGENAAAEAKMAKYWVDMEGEAAFGYWWNAIKVAITDTPTVAEMHTIFGLIENAFRSFQLPKAIASEDGEYPYEQETFTSDNLFLLGSKSMGPLLRQALREQTVPVPATAAPTNLYRDWADYALSAFLTET